MKQFFSYPNLTVYFERSIIIDVTSNGGCVMACGSEKSPYPRIHLTLRGLLSRLTYLVN